jgi:CubicO group peptidase (beta-lactamase class C family)
MTVVVLAAAVLAMPPADAEAVAAAEAYLAKTFPADKPGAAVAMCRMGRPLLLAGYGSADLAKKTPITPDSVFDLASVSKQFTAMAVMILAERGKLNYDDELRRWVPEMPEFAGHRALTVRDLLNQCSGLPDYLGLFRGNDSEFARLRNADLPTMFRGQKLTMAPGTRHEYSNSNYALLPLVVEKASGQRFSQFVADAIFAPAGMTASRVMDEVPLAIPNRVTGYKRTWLIGPLAPTRKDGPVCGDGNVFASARDMARWDAALWENRLVKPETLELAFTGGGITGGGRSDYGFGWVVRIKDGKKGVWHNGGWAGTRTMIARGLTNGITAVVLCNSESATPETVAMELVKIVRADDAP